jgi:peptidoglycan/LPS O-acetylase OafA/YrhL
LRSTSDQYHSHQMAGPAPRPRSLLAQSAAMQKPETFTALNGLRFLAALAVVIFHYAPRVGIYIHLPLFIKSVINEGPCAVSFFFILSGFVLAHRHLYGRSHIQTTPAFYWARFVRLYPAYLLAFLLFLPIAVQRFILSPSPASGGARTFVLSAVLSCLMLQSWTPLAQAWNGPSWSLSVEAFMYLMFPVIGFRLAKLSCRTAICVLFVSWLIPLSLALAYVTHWIPDETWCLYVTNNPVLWTPLFVMGICASRLVPLWKKVSENKANTLSMVAFMGLILVSLSWPHQWSDVFVTGGIGPFLVAVIVFSTRTTGWITRMIGGPLLSRLGEASYTVYILQAPLWRYWQPLTNYLRRMPPETNIVPLWQFVGFLPFLVLTSLAVQRFIELPVRAWLKDCKKSFESRSQQPAKTFRPQTPPPNPIESLGVQRVSMTAEEPFGSCALRSLRPGRFFCVGVTARKKAFNGHPERGEDSLLIRNNLKELVENPRACAIGSKFPRSHRCTRKHWTAEAPLAKLGSYLRGRIASK